MSERRFNPEKMGKLDSPERRKALPPEKLLQMIPLGTGGNLLDLGAGTGYFTLPAAKMTQGTIYALDIEPRMLDVLRSRLEEEGITNVEFLQGPAEQIPLSDGTVQGVIASLILHEVESLVSGLEEIYRVLEDGGYLFCLEWEDKEMDQGPPRSHRIHSSEMEQAMEKVGFTVVKRDFPTDAHYILLAKK